MLILLIMTMLLTIGGQGASPDGFVGKMLVAMMKRIHKPLSKWALGFLRPGDWHEALDIDCGDGITVKYLAEKLKCGRICGTDRHRENLERCRMVYKNRPGVFFRKGCAWKIPYADSSFDLVTAVDSVYFWKDPRACFREIARVLRPGGMFVIVLACDTPDPNNDVNWSNLIDGMKIRPAAELRDILMDSGFPEVEVHRKGRSYVTMLAKRQ